MENVEYVDKKSLLKEACEVLNAAGYQVVKPPLSDQLMSDQLNGTEYDLE
jgi:hypothetical protein